MKKLGAVAMMATMVTVNAFAGDHTINLMGRGGWTYKNNDPAKTQISNSSSMNFDYLRTTFAGVVTPSVKYTVTADFLNAHASPDVVDQTSDYVYEAFLTKTFSTGTSATLGKRAVLIGGREYDYSDLDRYTNSYFFDATPSNQMGLTLSQDVAGQTFMIQYFNGNKDNGKVDANNSPVNAQSKYGYGVAWYGDFAGGMIKPIVGYSTLPEAVGTSSTGGSRAYKGADNFLSAGVQINTPHDITIEADYNLLTEKDASLNAAGTAGSKSDLKTTSITAVVRYNAERFAPFARFIADTRKNGSVKTEQRSAYDLGLEFKEAKDDAVRYHVVYSGSTVKSNMNTTEVKSSPSSILVGIKFDAAILK